MNWGFPGGTSDKEPACQRQRYKRGQFSPWVRKIPWSRKWHPTSVFLPGKFHGQRSLAVHGATKSQTRLSSWVHTHTQYWTIRPEFCSQGTLGAVEGHRQMGNHNPVQRVWPTLGGTCYPAWELCRAGMKRLYSLKNKRLIFYIDRAYTLTRHAKINKMASVGMWLTWP